MRNQKRKHATTGADAHCGANARIAHVAGSVVRRGPLRRRSSCATGGKRPENFLLDEARTVGRR
jgi:hypothetical protein